MTAPVVANLLAARLDRLPLSRTIWRLVLLISLGGVFELYDIFLSGYIAPGLVRSGLFANTTAGLFAIEGIGFFVFCNFAGMFVGCVGFGSIADRLGRRSIFVTSLIWYSIATAIMAAQNTAIGVDTWRFIAGIGIGLEQITIDTYLAELVAPRGRGKVFAFYQFVEFCVVPIVALLGWLLVPKEPFGVAGWRWVTLIGSAGALMVWWLRRSLPESPRWLAVHGREAERSELWRSSKRRCPTTSVGLCRPRAPRLRARSEATASARSSALLTGSVPWSCPSLTCSRPSPSMASGLGCRRY
jgi:putative MFS transporter